MSFDPVSPYPVAPTVPSDIRTAPQGALTACSVCGGQPGPRDTPDAWATPERQHPAWRGPGDHAWRNRHRGCIPTAQYVVLRITGQAMSDWEAREVVADANFELTARGAGVVPRKPFGWVNQKQVELLTALAAGVLAARGPRPNALGRCGVCGVSAAKSWTVVMTVLAWSDGSPAPVCCDCLPVTEADTSATRMRDRAIARLAGVRVSPSVRVDEWFGLKIFSSVAREDERHLEGQEPFTYRPAGLAAVREQVLHYRPDLIEDPLERAKRMAALQAERVAAEPPAAPTVAVEDGWEN